MDQVVKVLACGCSTLPGWTAMQGNWLRQHERVRDCVNTTVAVFTVGCIRGNGREKGKIAPRHFILGGRGHPWPELRPRLGPDGLTYYS